MWTPIQIRSSEILPSSARPTRLSTCCSLDASLSREDNYCWLELNLLLNN